LIDDWHPASNLTTGELFRRVNKNGKAWADGDFNGDGNVDFNDLAMLAQRYNTTLTAPAESARPTSAASTAADSAAVMATRIPPTMAGQVEPTREKSKSIFSVTPVVKPISSKAKPPQRRKS